MDLLRRDSSNPLPSHSVCLHGSDGAGSRNRSRFGNDVGIGIVVALLLPVGTAGLPPVSNVPLEADIVELLPPLLGEVGLLPLLPLLVVDALGLDPLPEAGVGRIRLGDVGVAILVLVGDELLQTNVPVDEGGARGPFESDVVEGHDALLSNLRLLARLELLVFRALLGHPLAQRDDGRVGVFLMTLALPGHVARVVGGLVGLELLETGIPSSLVAGEAGRHPSLVGRSVGLGGILLGKPGQEFADVDLGRDGGIVGGGRPLEADALEDADAIVGQADDVLPGLLARVQVADVADPGGEALVGLVVGGDVAAVGIGRLVPVQLVEHVVPVGAGVLVLDGEDEADVGQFLAAFLGHEGGGIALLHLLVLEALEGDPVSKALPLGVLLVLVLERDEAVPMDLLVPLEVGHALGPAGGAVAIPGEAHGR
mmetsp:Transcript_16059/g.46109  ORF Transcript_16059/g.46109 Transcript_16059/m.46109 type:complete len:426 (-) Transcript_16059:541-1818(-)